MSSTNKTTYYELPQFVDDDIFNPLVDDNDAYDKIDTALHDIAEAEAGDASEIVGVKGRVTTVEGKVENLETATQNLSGAVVDLNGEVTSLDGRLDTVEDDIDNPNTGLKAKVSALERQNGDDMLPTTAQTLSGAVNEIFDILVKANANKMIFMPIAYYPSSDASGACSVLKTLTGKTVMFDSGASHSYALIKAELQKNEINHIDYFILSHYHADHYGNIENLFTDNYFDASTIVYLPRHSEVVTQADETYVRGLFTNNTVIAPSSNADLTVDDVIITFMNCDASDVAYYDNMVSPNANNYSVCNYISMGDTTIFITGDIHQQAENHLLELGVVKQCDIMTLPHHALVEGIKDEFYYTVAPSYGIAFATSYYEQIPRFLYKSAKIDILETLGCKIYSCGNGAIYTAFIGDNIVFNGNGRELCSTYYTETDMNVYINQSYTGEISNGCQTTPFKNFTQAIASISHLQDFHGKVNINFVGEYNTATNENIHIESIPFAITLVGNKTGDTFNVNISNLSITDCAHVTLSNIHVNNTGNQSAVNIDGSIVIIHDCLIDYDVTSSTPSSGRGISCTQSILNMYDTTISNKVIAIVANAQSTVSCNRISGSNNTYLAGGNYSSLIDVRGTITFTNLLSQDSQKPAELIFRKENEKAIYHIDATPCNIFSDDGNATTKSVNIDLSANYYSRHVYRIKSVTGQVDEFIVWVNDVSTPTTIESAQNPSYDTDFAYSFSGKVLTITYNSIVSLEMVM